MSESWPPTSFRAAYSVDEDLSTGKLTYDLSVPRTMTEIDLATVRVSRYGGPTAEDHRFRERLFGTIGSITVAGAQVEASMKRLLVLLAQEPTIFEVVDYDWTTLHKKLRVQSDESEPRRRRLRRALDWAEERKLAERRNTAVHGAWWTYSGCGARVSRWPRKATSHISSGEIEFWEAVATDLWRYVTWLDELLGEDWPRAVLPEQAVPVAFKAPGV